MINYVHFIYIFAFFLHPFSTRSQAQNCSDSEVFDNCLSSCQPTCDDQNWPRNCPRICTPGCICKPGLVRDDRNSPHPCFPATDCPKKVVSTQGCDSDTEVWSECGASPCSQSCDNQSCEENCIAGCVCLDGLVRDEETKKCISRDSCKCDKNISTFDPYSAECQNTCRFPNDGHRHLCPFVTEPGCRCAPGYILDDSNRTYYKCIQEDKCPTNMSD